MPGKERAPLYDPVEDPNNEKFINANYKGPKGKGKFVPINEAPDIINENDDFELADNKELAGEYETLDHSGDLSQEFHSKDLSKYADTYRGSLGSEQLESFHIDHDNKRTITVSAGDGLIKKRGSVNAGDSETDDLRPKRGRINRQTYTNARKERGERSGTKRDNLKTMPLGEKERQLRGSLRKVLHSEELIEPIFEDEDLLPELIPELIPETDYSTEISELEELDQRKKRQRIDQAALEEARKDVNQYLKESNKLASYHVENGKEIAVKEDGTIKSESRRYPGRTVKENNFVDNEYSGSKHGRINRQAYTKARKEAGERADSGADNLKTRSDGAKERSGRGIKGLIRDFFSGHKNRN